MLRSLEAIISSMPPANLLANGDEKALVRGGGSARYKTAWHWHDCHMVLLPSFGAIEFKHEKRLRGSWISEERFAFVPASHAHETEAAQASNSHLALYISDSAFSRLSTEIGAFRKLAQKVGGPSIYPMTHQIRSLQRMCGAADPGDQIASAAQKHLFLALLLTSLAQVERSESLNDASRDAHGDLVVREICRFLEDNIGGPCALDELSKRFGISRRHLTRLFREKTGRSVGQYHEEARLRAASKLLRETSLPVSEVAWRLGYDSGPSLSRAMKKAMGLAPTQFRDEWL
ncbi:AraC family transcriptional regulator [Xanthobacter sp. DSM 24535]|uniref:helix-turn-helix domain-containing protein n=1 Tax=Roseixanthobacter psychrophilus TaxID=3119917 RepID=UPI00372C7FE3